MNPLSRHPDLGALERVASDEAHARERRRVRRHLESCQACRSRYAWIRGLPDRLTDDTRPELPMEELEERILRARRSGGRVILPVGRLEATKGTGWRFERLAAVAGLVLASSAVLWFAFRGTAEADLPGGELTLDPAAPRPGDRIEVEYRPSRDLADETRLVLRGLETPPIRYETPPPPPRVVAELERAGEVFRGHLTLAPDVVYARLVVESADGAVVDDRGGRAWHVDVHPTDGPSREALRAHAILADDWDESFRAARLATELYPDDPRLQASRLSFELGFLTRSERDSAVVEHRRNFDRMAQTLAARDSLGPAELAGLVEYARAVGDTAATRRWIESMTARYPAHPETVWYRVPPPPDSGARGELERYLAELEDLWREAGPHPAISSPGLWTARRLGDMDDILTWARRRRAAPGWGEDPASVPLALAATPAARDSALPFLRSAIRNLTGSSGVRPLGRTVAEHRQSRRTTMRPLLAALADLLDERGAQEAALDTLRLAASIGWSAGVYARLAEVELASGDSTAAATSLARALAVPFQRGEGESIDATLGPRLVGPDQWEVLVRNARDEMRRRVLAQSTDRPLLVEPVYAFDARRTRHDLKDLRHGTVTIVAFWDPRNGVAVGALPDLRRTTYLTRALGGEVIIVTRAPPDDRIDRLLSEHAFEAPLYHDLDRTVTNAFGSRWVPEYHVLDFEGRIRYADSRLDDLLAQVDALLNEPRLAAAGRVAP